MRVTTQYFKNILGIAAVLMLLSSPIHSSVIKGGVYDYYGTTPLTGIQVMAADYSGADETIYQAQTNDQCAYELTVPAGEYLISTNPNSSSQRYSAQYYGGANSSYYAETITVADGETMEAVNFYLWAGFRVSGNLTDENGQPANGSLYAVDNTTGYYYWGLTGTSSSSANGGGFTLNLPQGVYSLIAYSDGAIPSAEYFPLIVNDDVSELQLSYPPSIFIDGLVQTSAAAPVESIRVDALDAENGYSYGYATTDDFGHYRINGLPKSRSYLVLARSLFHPEYLYWDVPGTFYPSMTDPGAAQTVTGSGSGSSNINITMQDSAGSISGYVRNASGSPIEGAYVYDFYMSDSLNSFAAIPQRGAYTDANGYYQLIGIGAGAVGIAATATDFSPKFWNNISMTTTLATATKIQVEAGTEINDVNFNLVSTSTLGSAPVIFSISPHLIFKTQFKTVTIAGENFSNNAKVELIDEYPLHYEGRLPIVQSFTTNANEISVNIETTTHTAVGSYYLAITNPDGQYCLTGFDVLLPQDAPQISILASPENFIPASTLTLGWNMENLTVDNRTVDIYIGLVLPTSDVIFYDGTTFTLDFVKSHDSLQIASEMFQAQSLLFEIPLGGAQMPSGDYLWFAVMANAGTFDVVSFSLKSVFY